MNLTDTFHSSAEDALTASAIQARISESMPPLFRTIDHVQILSMLQDTRRCGYRPVIIYHADCADGLVAALMVYKFMIQHFDFFHPVKGLKPASVNYEPVLIPARYGESPPQLDRHATGLVVIVDFTYSYEQLQEMSRDADELVVIDHHYSAVSKLIAAHKANPVLTNFHMYLTNDPQNQYRSGAGLAADLLRVAELYHARYAVDRTGVERLLDLAQRYDLWKHDGNPESPEAHLNFFIKEILRQDRQPIQQIQLLDDIVERSMFDLILRAGQTLGEPVINRIKEQLKQTQMYRLRSGDQDYHIPGCPVVHADASLASYYLRSWGGAAAPFSVTWECKSPERVEYSLRSIDPDFDVSEIAANFGGGGHKRAAGFVTDVEPSEFSAFTPM